MVMQILIEDASIGFKALSKPSIIENIYFSVGDTIYWSVFNNPVDNKKLYPLNYVDCFVYDEQEMTIVIVPQ